MCFGWMLVLTSKWMQCNELLYQYLDGPLKGLKCEVHFGLGQCNLREDLRKSGKTLTAVAGRVAFVVCQGFQYETRRSSSENNATPSPHILIFYIVKMFVFLCVFFPSCAFRRLAGNWYKGPDNKNQAFYQMNSPFLKF